MEKAGIVHRSSSPWSSPLHMVPKPDGTWRPCGDFCQLNTATVPDPYPLPAVADCSARIFGSKFFSKLGLQKGYFQIPMRSADIPKLHYSLWTLLISPPSFRPPEHSPDLPKDEGQDLWSSSIFFVFLVNIMVFSNSLASHQQHLPCV